jgi:hypothetical protein
MDSLYILTILESAYLFFVYFLYKTTYTFGTARFDKETQALGSLFVHDTKTYENKVCMFGKIMALIAILLGIARLYYLKHISSNILISLSLIFCVTCLVLAYNMNFTAFVYLIPLIFSEAYFMYSIIGKPQVGPLFSK